MGLCSIGLCTLPYFLYILISSETKPTSSKGLGGLCSSTLEKLKGFTCIAEPSVKHSDSQREEKKIDYASRKICEQESSIWPPRDVKDQHNSETRLQETEEELEDEEEEDVVEKKSSGLVAPKQVYGIL